LTMFCGRGRFTATKKMPIRKLSQLNDRILLTQGEKSFTVRDGILIIKKIIMKKPN